MLVVADAAKESLVVEVLVVVVVEVLVVADAAKESLVVVVEAAVALSRPKN